MPKRGEVIVIEQDGSKDVSAAMMDRITALIAERVAARRQSKRPGDVVAALIVELITVADTDSAVETLFRLLDDYETKREESAIARVFNGAVDLVALVAALDANGDA